MYYCFHTTYTHARLSFHMGSSYTSVGYKPKTLRNHLTNKTKEIYTFERIYTRDNDDATAPCPSRPYKAPMEAFLFMEFCLSSVYLLSCIRLCSSNFFPIYWQKKTFPNIRENFFFFKNYFWILCWYSAGWRSGLRWCGYFYIKACGACIQIRSYICPLKDFRERKSFYLTYRLTIWCGRFVFFKLILFVLFV